jgi:type I restriction enzyme, S subunit
MRFDDLAEINPSVPIRKGEIRPFIDMSALPQHARDVSEVGERGFKGSGSRFQNGDTLIARITPCLENGKGALIHSLPEGVPGFGSTEFIVARARSESDTRFVYYLTRSEEFRDIAISRMEGTSGRQRVSWQQIASIEIPDLSPDEREEVGEILGLLDDKIELNRRMATTLEEMARALYRSWFVDFDPVKAKAEGLPPAFMDEATAALFPDRFGDDGLPEGWELTTIGAVADVVGGATPSTKAPEYWDDGIHAWATPRDLSGLSDTFLIETSRKITDQGLARIGSGLSPAGSMLLSSRAPIGYRVIARHPVAVNQGFIVIRETETITGIEAYLWCEINSETILSNANGSTFQEISKKNFRPIPYILADAPVRQAFDQLVRPMFERLATLSEENRDLTDLRDSLLPKLMSGELRVGEAQDQIEEVA